MIGVAAGMLLFICAIGIFAVIRRFLQGSTYTPRVFKLSDYRGTAILNLLELMALAILWATSSFVYRTPFAAVFAATELVYVIDSSYRYHKQALTPNSKLYLITGLAVETYMAVTTILLVFA